MHKNTKPMQNKELEEKVNEILNTQTQEGVWRLIDLKETTKKLSTLIQKREEEAVIEYRINFERGVKKIAKHFLSQTKGGKE